MSQMNTSQQDPLRRRRTQYDPARQPAIAMNAENVRAFGDAVRSGAARSGATPSGPVLDRRNQRDQKLRDSGVDPVMLRRELNARRTTNEAMLRQRRALARQATMLEKSGDAASAEQVRAQIALMEGARREAAGDTARSSALIRGGESRLGDDVTIEQVRARQEVETRRRALADQTRDTDMTIAGRENTVRDTMSQQGVVDAETGLTTSRTAQRDAGVADTVSERTVGSRTDAGVLDAENRVAELIAREQEIEDQIKNGQGDRDRNRELEQAQIDRIRAEQDLARRQAEGALQAEDATLDDRVGTADANAEMERIRAEQQRDRARRGGTADDAITTIFGEGGTPEERTELVSEMRTAAQSIRTMSTDQQGIRGALNFSDAPARPVSTDNNIVKVRGLLDSLATRRAAFTPDQYQAYVAFVRQEIAREVPDWASTDSPFTGEKVPRTTAGGIRNKAEANTLWARLRAELGLSGGSGG